jgi:DNA-binding XRE family transcriptional regulator
MAPVQVLRRATHWSRASMARRTGLSRSSIGRIWRKFDLKPHLIDCRSTTGQSGGTDRAISATYHD